MKTLKRILANFIIPLAAIALIIFIWAIVAKVKNNPLVLPMPKEVAERFFLLYQEKNFWKSVGKTLSGTLLSFGISFLLAMLLSVLSALIPFLNRFLSPIISLLRTAPTVAVILILYAFFSNKTLSLIVGILIAFPILYSAFFTAVSQTDKRLLTMAKVYKIPPIQRIIHIYLPSVAYTVFDLSASTLSLTFKVIVAAEILTLVPTSLGGKIQTSYASFDIAYLLAWTLLTVVIGYLLEIILFILKKICIRWQK